MDKKEAIKELTLNEKLSLIQVEMKAKKSRFNSFGKYNFRSAEDLLEAVKPYLTKYNVTVTVSESLIDNGLFPILESTATISDGTLGEYAARNAIHARAIVGVDLDQKGMQMPQKFGSASSYGKKYALGNLFLIDDTQDPDHGKAEPETKKSALTVKDPAFEKAKDFVTKGGSIDTIKKKYELDAEASKILESL
jgi:hypothetical protein